MKLKRLHYAWVLVIVTSIIAFVNATTIFSFGLFLKPLAEEFNTGRGVISGARSLGGLLSGVLGIAIGSLTDKHGPRILLIANGLLAGIGLLLMSRVNSVWQIYLLYGVIISIGMSCYHIPTQSTIPRWFTRRRETALGIIQASLGLGGMILTPSVQWLIVRYGWRPSYLAIGLLTLAVVIPLAQFVTHSPQRIGLRPYGENGTLEGKQLSASDVSGIPFMQAIRTGRFWLFGAVLFCFTFSLGVVETHIVPYATDIGITATTAANMLALIAGFGIIGKLSVGIVSDRMGTRFTLNLYLTVVTLALLELLFAREVSLLYMFAIIFGIGYGGVITLAPGVTAELFGLKYLSVIFASLSLLSTVGRAIGPTLVGSLFDITGNYFLAFLILVVLSVLSVMLGLILLRYKYAKG